MARSRTLKPDFWTDSRIVKLTPYARLFYQGMWNFSICDHGHLEDDAEELKLKILPADPVDPEELIVELVKHGRVMRKQAPDGRRYLHVPTLDKHTKMDTRWSPRCPYCALEGSAEPASTPPTTDEHAETHASSDEHTGAQSSKGKERKGKEGDSARKRGTRLPEHWRPSSELLAWAREKVPHVDVQLETMKFKNHFIGAAGAKGVKLDWNRTFQNWLLRSVEFGGARASPPPVGPALTLFNPDDD